MVERGLITCYGRLRINPKSFVYLSCKSVQTHWTLHLLISVSPSFTFKYRVESALKTTSIQRSSSVYPWGPYLQVPKGILSMLLDLRIKTTFCWSLGWSLCTSFTVDNLFQNMWRHLAREAAFLEQTIRSIPPPVISTVCMVNGKRFLTLASLHNSWSKQ